MSRYAADTSVSSEASRAEIERTLQRYGGLIRFPASSGGCWEWMGDVNEAGYGEIGHRRAHRVIYEAFRGAVPAGLDLDHRCHGMLCPGGVTCPHRRCVNPSHLQPETRGNNARRASAGPNRLHADNRCKRGHEMDLSNTYISPRGQRHCIACRSLREAARPDRRR